MPPRLHNFPCFVWYQTEVWFSASKILFFSNIIHYDISHYSKSVNKLLNWTDSSHQYTPTFFCEHQWNVYLHSTGHCNSFILCIAWFLQAQCDILAPLVSSQLQSWAVLLLNMSMILWWCWQNAWNKPDIN